MKKKQATGWSRFDEDIRRHNESDVAGMSSEEDLYMFEERNI